MRDWQKTLHWPRLLLFLALVFVLITFSEPYARQALQNARPQSNTEEDEKCKLPELPGVLNDGLASSYSVLPDTSFERQIQRLSAAVNISTISYGSGANAVNDPRYDTFNELHKVLSDLFPRV